MKKRNPPSAAPSLSVARTLPSWWFLLASALLAFLSYAPVPVGTRLPAGFLALLLLGILARRVSVPKPASLPDGSTDPSPLLSSPVFWIAVAAAAWILRTVRLSTLFRWPSLDEGTFGFLGSVLALEGWDGRFIYHTTQLPPLTHWAMGGWFRLFEPSLGSLWDFPAVLSVVAAVAGIAAFRGLLPEKEARIATAFLLVSFWPVFVGRVAVNLILFLFLEFAALAVLGTACSPSRRRSIRWVLLLGVVSGLGFYSYLGWPFVFCFLLIALVRHARREGLPLRGRLVSFLLPSLLLPLPMLFEAVRDGFGQYLLRSSLASGEGAGWPLSSLAYIGAMLWGAETSLFAFKPLWGGYLDPVLGALFLTGLAFLILSRTHPSRGNLLAGLVLALTPALLTRDLEFLRLTPALPFVLAVAACGTVPVLRVLPTIRRDRALLLLLGIIASLGAYHLFAAVPSYWDRDPSKESFYHSKEYAAAWDALRKKAEKDGPGRIMPQMHADPYDQTLAVAVHPFNALDNPRLKDASPNWAAIVVNIHYVPFLAPRFPGSQWRTLPSFERRSDGGWVLGILPVDAASRPILEKWGQFHREMRKITYQTLNCGVGRPRDPILAAIDRLLVSAEGDPFLTALSYELMAVHHGANQEPAKIGPDQLSAIGKGVPAAHLYNELGAWYASQQRWDEARSAFEKAVAAPNDRTPARENLRLLDKR